MLENLTRKQRKIVIIIGIIIVLIVMYFIYQKAGSNEFIEKDEDILIAQNASSDNQVNDIDKEEAEEIIIVHIAGAVKSPGVVKLKKGSRMEDAIEMAGGLTQNADISNVNLAYVLDDGVKIVMPEKGNNQETNEIINNDAGENVISETSSKLENKTSLININKASQTELESLSGVGASLASKIIAYRNSNGKFSKIEDIKKVSGIGDSKYEAIKDFICTN